MSQKPEPVDVDVEFDTKAKRRTLLHKGKHVSLAAGKGKLKVIPNQYDLILFVYEGSPGTTAKVTLTPPKNYKLEISGHPIEDEIAQGKQISGDNRFFRVRPNGKKKTVDTPSLGAGAQK